MANLQRVVAREVRVVGLSPTLAFATKSETVVVHFLLEQVVSRPVFAKNLETTVPLWFLEQAVVEVVLYRARGCQWCRERWMADRYNCCPRVHIPCLIRQGRAPNARFSASTSARPQTHRSCGCLSLSQQGNGNEERTDGDLLRIFCSFPAANTNKLFGKSLLLNKP